MKKITFALFAYNEEKRIAYTVKNLIQYGEVLILDGGSTDRTEEIAEGLGAKLYIRPKSNVPYVETTENFEFLKSIVKTDWVYWGYVDNILPKKLLDKLSEIAKEEKYKIVYAPMYTYLWGNTKNHIQKSRIPTIFHKDYMDFSHPRIHGMGDFTGIKSEKLFLPKQEEYAVKHFSTYDMNKFVAGHMRYAETEAREKFERGEKFSLIKMLAAMVRYMWIYGKSGYKNGVLGLIIVLHYAFFRLMTYTKLYELENDITIENIEKKYSKMKEEMLKEFK